MPDLLKDNRLSTGGACVRVYALSKGFIELGHQVGVLTWKGANRYVGPINEKLELVETYPSKGGIRYIRIFYFYFYLMLKAFRRYDPDYLIIKGCELNNGILAFISSIQRVPIIYLVTNDKDADERSRSHTDKITHIFFKYSLKMSNLIVCQNHYQYSKFKALYPNKRFMIMHNPYYFKSDLPPLKPHKERNYVAWIGIFSPQKNLALLYRIVKLMPETNFKIAGSFACGTMARGRNADQETMEAIEALKSCKNVQFVGFLGRKDVVSFLSEAYTLINTSHFEGFSNTYLEALITGTPVITRKLTDPDDFLANNNLGFIVDDEKDYQRKINLVKNGDSFDQEARRYRTYILEHHKVSHLVSNLIKKLTDLKAEVI